MTTWKRLVPLLFALAIAANLLELATLTVLPWNGNTGLMTVPAGQQFQLKAASVYGPAQAAGFAVGDRVDSREVFAANGFAYPVAGVPYRLIAHRGDRTIEATVRPFQPPLDRFQIVRLLGVFWLIAFALLIAKRSAPSRENSLLLAFLLLLAMESPFGRMQWPDGRLQMISLFLNQGLWFAAMAVLVCYSQCFGMPLSSLRKTLSYVAFSLIAIAYLYVLLTVVALAYPFMDAYAGVFAVLTKLFADWSSLSLAILTLVAAIPAARVEDRQRLFWVIVSLAPFAVGLTVTGITVGTIYLKYSPWYALQNASFFFIPAGLTYAALAKRMFDIGFVINRAAVFAGVSIVVVGAFVLVEWALGKWFENASHDANLAVNAGLALVLGLSIRYVHKKIDAAVDNVFFRKRHENETALRRFAREAAFFTDAHTLIDRVQSTILAHSEATTADVVLASDIDPNDAAVVAMRAWHEPVDLTNLATSLHGDTAFPMLAHGTFVGAMVCGPKKTGERYAPDEIESLRELAHGVGLALEGFERKGNNGVSLEQIAATLSAISAKLDRSASS
jgi:hypothetical protein